MDGWMEEKVTALRKIVGYIRKYSTGVAAIFLTASLCLRAASYGRNGRMVASRRAREDTGHKAQGRGPAS
jgi:hypothetical protein